MSPHNSFKCAGKGGQGDSMKPFWILDFRFLIGRSHDNKLFCLALGALPSHFARPRRRRSRPKFFVSDTLAPASLHRNRLAPKHSGKVFVTWDTSRDRTLLNWLLNVRWRRAQPLAT